MFLANIDIIFTVCVLVLFVIIYLRRSTDPSALIGWFHFSQKWPFPFIDDDGGGGTMMMTADLISADMKWVKTAKPQW